MSVAKIKLQLPLFKYFINSEFLSRFTNTHYYSFVFYITSITTKNHIRILWGYLGVGDMCGGGF